MLAVGNEGSELAGMVRWFPAESLIARQRHGAV